MSHWINVQSTCLQCPKPVYVEVSAVQMEARIITFLLLISPLRIKPFTRCIIIMGFMSKLCTHLTILPCVSCSLHLPHGCCCCCCLFTEPSIPSHSPAFISSNVALKTAFRHGQRRQKRTNQGKNASTTRDWRDWTELTPTEQHRQHRGNQKPVPPKQAPQARASSFCASDHVHG